MLTVLINRYCPEAYHTLERSLRVADCQRKKLLVNPWSSPGLGFRTVYRGWGFCSSRKKQLFSWRFYFLSLSVSELQKPSSQWTDPRKVFVVVVLRRSYIVLSFWVTGHKPKKDFGVVVFIYVISSSKQTFIFLKCFYCAYFPIYRNRPYWDSNSGHFFRISLLSGFLPENRE